MGLELKIEKKKQYGFSWNIHIKNIPLLASTHDGSAKTEKYRFQKLAQWILVAISNVASCSSTKNNISLWMIFFCG